MRFLTLLIIWIGIFINYAKELKQHKTKPLQRLNLSLSTKVFDF